jgi:peroxiredoxin
MKAVLYAQIFDNPQKATELVQQLKRDFPDTQPGKNADDILANLKQQAEAKKIKSGLVEGAKFPDFDEKDIAGKPLSVANYKGNVVLVDFWATWCGPCVGELPNVIKTYEKHHANGFEIIGISLDQDEKKLKNFTSQRKMTWQQYFDGKGWENKLAGKYGVQSIPATFLLDREGKIIGKDLRGPALDEAVTKALAKK